MNFGQSISSVFKQYFVFSGRACRSEYWWFVLSTVIAWFVSAFISPILPFIIFIAIIVPSLAVFVRRLHDTGRSAWWLLLFIVPFGSIVLLVFTILAGEREANRYGPDPLGSPASVGIEDFVGSQSSQVDGRYCTSCGSRLESAANFCRSCGTAV